MCLPMLRNKILEVIDVYLTKVMTEIERNARREGVYEDFSDLFEDINARNEEFNQEFPLIDLPK